MSKQYIRHVEGFMAGWHKNLPHLPSGYLHWLVNNTWRVAIIGLLMSIYSMFVLIPHLILSLVLTPSVNIIAPHVPYHHETIGLAWLALSVTLIVFFVTTVILLFAVKPVKDKEKDGWDMLFTTYLLNVGLGIFTTWLVPSLFELIIVIFITIGAGYLLLEIRSEFHKASRPHSGVKV